MSKEFNHIDDIFKKSFEHASMPTPDSALQAIQSQLAMQSAATTTAAVSTLKIVAFVSAAVVSIGALVYVSFQQNNSKSPMAESKVAVLDTLDAPVNTSIGNSLQGSQPNGVAPNQILVNVENRNGVKTTDIEETNGKKDIEVKGTQEAHRNFILKQAEGFRGISKKEDRAVNNDASIPLVPLYTEVNAVSKASPEEKNELKQVTVATKSCKGRFEIDLEGEVAGAHELALGIQGKMALYEWGSGSRILGNVQGREVSWKGPIYVKKPQEMNFWVRAHFMDGCRDTVLFSRWFTPKNGEGEEIFPSVFTPNGDGFNDSFYVLIPTPEKFNILVMDMRGSRVFSAENPQQKWSGYVGNKKCESGIYKVQVRRKYFGESDFEIRNFTVELRK
jgi:gliding motility-associated-like protein